MRQHFGRDADPDQFELVVTDHSMPGMSGLKVEQALNGCGLGKEDGRRFLCGHPNTSTDFSRSHMRRNHSLMHGLALV